MCGIGHRGSPVWVETRIYFGILAAIAAGKEKFGEIINATHEPGGPVVELV